MRKPIFTEYTELKQLFHAYHAGFKDALESPIFFVKPQFPDYLKQYYPELFPFWNDEMRKEFVELTIKEELLP